MIGQFNGLYFTVQPAKIKSLLTLNRHPPPQFEPGDKINIVLTLFSLCLLLVMNLVFSAWSYACASCLGSKSKQKRIGWLLTVRTLNSVSGISKMFLIRCLQHFFFPFQVPVQPCISPNNSHHADSTEGPHDVAKCWLHYVQMSYWWCQCIFCSVRLCLTTVILYMEKLCTSDWLKTRLFLYNTSTKL